MKQYTISGYRRVSKATAKRLYMAGNRVFMIACNLRPDNLYMPPYTLNKASRESFVVDDIGLANDFNGLIASYEYYNCNGETGRYAAFYIQEGGR